jgi:putative spermidine/putrescine transport system substrate-binding protein
LAPSRRSRRFRPCGPDRLRLPGGAYQKAQTIAILDPSAKKLGITINQDSIPDAWPAIKSQVASGKPTWDVVDVPTGYCLRGGEQGLLEKLDFSKLPNGAAMPEAYRSAYSVAYEFYSSVLAYSRKKFSAEAAPNSWADFWDVKKFPGRRALRNHPIATLEAALMADGVAPDKLYPLDVDRAFKKLEEIKPNITVWWTSGAQSAQLLNDGEVDMVMAWNGRVSALTKEGAKVAFTYNQGVLQSTSLCILKDAPNLRPRSASTGGRSCPPGQPPLHIDCGLNQGPDTEIRPSAPPTAERARNAKAMLMSTPGGRRHREAAENAGSASCRNSFVGQPGAECITHSAPSQDHPERPVQDLGTPLTSRIVSDAGVAMPALLVILLLVGLPVGWLAWQSVFHNGFTLENYRRIWSEDISWRSFALTFEISLLVTLLALLLGYPIAYAASVAPKRWGIIILALVVLPFWTSVLVRAYAWLALLQRTGVINQLLRQLGVIDEPLALVHTSFGTIVATLHILLPFMVLPLYATMQQIPRDHAGRRQSRRRSHAHLLADIFAALAARGARGKYAGLRARPRLLHHA